MKPAKLRLDLGFSSSGIMLYHSHRLQLQKKSEDELKRMLQQHESSLYSRLCSILGIPYSQKYLAIREGIRESIDWYESQKDR